MQKKQYGTLPDEAARQLQKYTNSTGELGADLHTLTQRLPFSFTRANGACSRVYRLYVKSFAPNRALKLIFALDNIPSSVDPDVALCLFRIVQEGLRNLKKHSGASKGQVRLRKAGDKLLVSVCDEGIGFDARDLGKKEGLGVRSMQERTYWLGGPVRDSFETWEGDKNRSLAPAPAEIQAGDGTTLNRMQFG